MLNQSKGSRMSCNSFAEDRSCQAGSELLAVRPWPPQSHGQNGRSGEMPSCTGGCSKGSNDIPMHLLGVSFTDQVAGSRSIL